MPVVVMICFARSGGTVVNRCLASLPGVVMLSEVNPLGGGWGRGGEKSPRTVRDQAREWYGIELRSRGFADEVVELEAECRRRGSTLIIRDWSFVNFVAHDDNDSDPPRRLLILEELAGRVEVVPFVLVRDAIDVWASRGVAAGEFFPDYLEYVRAIADLPRVRFEDFCSRPAVEIRRVCDIAGLPYSEDWRRWRTVANVSGDVQAARASRGRRAGVIRPLPRKHKSRAEIEAVDRNAAMIEANRTLGYPTAYGAVKTEKWYAALVPSGLRPIGRLVRNGLRRFGTTARDGRPPAGSDS